MQSGSCCRAFAGPAAGNGQRRGWRNRSREGCLSRRKADHDPSKEGSIAKKHRADAQGMSIFGDRTRFGSVKAAGQVPICVDG